MSLILPRRQLLKVGLLAATGIVAPAIIGKAQIPAPILFATKAAASSPFPLIAHAVGSFGTPSVQSITGFVDTRGAELIVAGTNTFSSTTTNLTDTLGNIFTPLTQYTGGSTTLTLYYCFNPTVGATDVFTFQDPGGAVIYPMLVVAAFSGLHASPLQNQNGAQTNLAVSSIQSGSISIGTVPQLCICIGGGASSPTTSSYAIDTGFTITDQVPLAAGDNVAIVMGYLIENSVTSISPTVSWTTASVGATISIASFK